MRLEDRFLAGTMALEEDAMPVFPSKAIVAIVASRVKILHHEGSDIQQYVEHVGMAEAEGCLNHDLMKESGIRVWEGCTCSHYSFEGEYDCYLEGSFREITEEEWTSYMSDEIVWDAEGYRAYERWNNP